MQVPTNTLNDDSKKIHLLIRARIISLIIQNVTEIRKIMKFTPQIFVFLWLRSFSIDYKTLNEKNLFTGSLPDSI